MKGDIPPRVVVAKPTVVGLSAWVWEDGYASRIGSLRVA